MLSDLFQELVNFFLFEVDSNGLRASLTIKKVIVNRRQTRAMERACTLSQLIAWHLTRFQSIEVDMACAFLCPHVEAHLTRPDFGRLRAKHVWCFVRIILVTHHYGLHWLLVSILKIYCVLRILIFKPTTYSWTNVVLDFKDFTCGCSAY